MIDPPASDVHDLNDLVSVFTTKDVTELDVVQSLLQSAGFVTATHGREQLHTLGGRHGLAPIMQLFGRRLYGAKLLVRAADAESAREFLLAQEDAEPFDYDPADDTNTSP